MLLAFKDLEVPSESLGVSPERGKIILSRPVVLAVSDEPIADSDACREEAGGPSGYRKWIHCKDGR